MLCIKTYVFSKVKKEKNERPITILLNDLDNENFSPIKAVLRATPSNWINSFINIQIDFF